jgi:hypothetical protein
LGISLAIASIVIPLVALFYFGFNYGPELLDQARSR